MVQWTQYIMDDSTKNYSEINSLSEIPGKKYLISGTWVFQHVWGGKYNSMLCLLDSAGNMMWSDSIINDYAMLSAWDQRSGIITISNTPSSISNPEANRIHISAFTLDGFLKKESWFGDPDSIYTLNSLIFLPDSTYLICGERNYDTSFLFNFNRNCDSLFYRGYRYFAMKLLAAEQRGI